MVYSRTFSPRKQTKKPQKSNVTQGRRDAQQLTLRAFIEHWAKMLLNGNIQPERFSISCIKGPLHRQTERCLISHTSSKYNIFAGSTNLYVTFHISDFHIQMSNN